MTGVQTCALPIWSRSLSVQHILYARGTVEERVAASNESKLRRMKTFNDGMPDLEGAGLE